MPGRALGCCLVLLLLAVPALAQEEPATSTTGVPGPAPIARPLDAPIDRTEYLVGAGDMVMISLFGDLSREYVLSVTPEGVLVVPGVGIARVGGLTLERAESVVRERILRFYQNVDVSLSLLQLRTFKVFVTGNVDSPGVRIATPVTRASEVIVRDTTSTPRIAPRNIILRRRDADTVRVDLARFEQLGELESNPPLREGDVLLIPHVDETVAAHGRIFFPGPYEFRRGETLAQFLRLVSGGQGFPADAGDTVRVARFTGTDERQVISLSRAEALGELGAGMTLQAFDAVFVPGVSNYKAQHAATVRGEVNRPGTYPIEPGVTTIRDLVALAGGFTDEASLATATLQRMPPRQSFTEGELERTPPELLTEQERQIVRIRATAASTNLVVDFKELFERGVDAFNQALQDGDELFVPEHRNQLVVVGAVAQPGIVGYSPGRSIQHFVELAGGFTRRADKGDMMVIKGKLGTPVPADNVRSLDPGDTLVVPFKEDRSVMEMIRGVNTVITTVAGLVFTILSLSGRL